MNGIVLACPDCTRKLARISTFRSASTVVRRTCRNDECRAHWQIVVNPIRHGEGFQVDKVTFSRLPSKWGTRKSDREDK